jgi:pimeloyl-ACP methyl ester carboxylesterase
MSYEIAAEEFRIPSDTAGIELYVRNKRPKDAGQRNPDKTLLYVHGTSQASEATFDLALEGYSWMDYLAARGWDVFLVDLRGYGRSSRPPEMRQPADANPPIVTTDVALRDFGAAADRIRRERGIARLAIMGWSWGTVTVGAYAARNPDKVSRLVQYAPSWLREKTPADERPLGAYATWTVEEALANLQTGVPEEKRGGLMERAWFEAWKEAALATDPEGARRTPPVVRSPNGAAHDRIVYWGAGKPYYDPAEIAVPTLLIRGEWDGLSPRARGAEVFTRLIRAPRKRFVEVGGGTHLLMLEKNRLQLFREVQLFLDEG